MSYHFSKVLSLSFDEAVARVTEKLKEQGFGVLTEIDVQATMKKKLDVEMPKYLILGACNPSFAYQALQLEDKIGTMLPCNVIVQQKPEGVEVSAIDPVASMQAISNPNLASVATQVRDQLKAVIDSL
ncbi:MAG: DUF302 domain-containing protein [Leptodesmis sp.]|uniref:DUF302 domain-containing protein n=1 Tax=Leptodesmis sp. TaxID=3100501 RepID=UPI003D10957A